MNQEKQMAEEATGISENPRGLGKLFACPGVELTPEAARNYISDGELVEVPNAGAGSYTAFFTDICKFEKVQVIDWTSSAGDWVFGVLDNECWYPAFQTNRYPRHGFSYSVDRARCADSFEDLCKMNQ